MGGSSSKLRFEQARIDLENKRREFKRTRQELGAAKSTPERRELRKDWDRTRQEITELESELRAAKHRWAEERLAQATGGETSDMGALPDFAVIGQRKRGTNFLYHLLTLHPHVRSAASKEPSFFNIFYGEGVGWYRQFFPKPKLKDGRMTITGEATPLMSHPLAPERMAAVVPEARLIALLRDPVDRTYSDYRWLVR